MLGLLGPAGANKTPLRYPKNEGRTHLLQVEVHALTIDDDVAGGGGDEFEGGCTCAVVAPVVDLDTGDHGVVSLVRVNCLGDEELEVVRNHALGDLQVWYDQTNSSSIHEPRFVYTHAQRIVPGQACSKLFRYQGKQLAGKARPGQL